jgi:hypothetical protein
MAYVLNGKLAITLRLEKLGLPHDHVFIEFSINASATVYEQNSFIAILDVEFG